MYQDLQIKKTVTTLATLFLLGILSLVMKMPVMAIELEVSSGSDWQSGTQEGVESISTEGELKLSPQGSWGAQSWKTPDKTIGVGSTFASDGEYIYVVRGYADITFWRYHPPTDTWETLTNLPRGAYYGADLQYLNGYIYAIFGGYQKTFARYDISENSWTLLANFPNFPWQGAAITTDETYLYAIAGNTTQEFYRYNPTTNSWITLASTPATLRSGADLTHINGYIYTPRGINTNTMYRYKINGNTWEAIANVPVGLNDDIDTTTDGTDLYVARQQNTPSFYRYNVASNDWTTLTSAPYNSQYAGVQYLEADGYIYFFRGINDYRFWKYDISANAFVGPAEAPATLNTGSNWVNYNNKMYVLRGGNTNTYYSYEPSTNVWTPLADALGTFNENTNGVVVGSLIYYLRANNSNSFYVYDTVANSWSSLANTPLPTRYNPGIAYPGAGDYLYATQGQNNNTFWRYKISTNTWQTVLDNLPGTPAIANLPSGVNAYLGAQLVATNTDVLFIAGNGIKRMLKYSIADNSWSELASPPFAPYYGTAVSLRGDKLIALAGYYKNDVYEYSISSNIWRKLPNMPGYGPNEIGAYTGASIAYDPNSNQFFATRGNARQEVLVYAPGLSNFSANGTWQSQSLDLLHVESWGALTSSGQTPGDSAISIKTRSSADNNSWEDWQEVVGTTISSSSQRYLQISVTLHASADLTQSPALSKLTLSYTGDTTPPTNPTTAVGSSQVVGGKNLTSGDSYRFITPYFSWNPGIDEETAVAGYYVYFGPDSSADPATVGVFLTNPNYQVNTALTTGVQYLRIATSNAVGLSSPPSTIFVYDYNGISPPQSMTATQTGDFSGTASNVITANDELKLEGLAEGFWQQESLSAVGVNMQRGGKNASYLEDSNKLYVLVGANNNLFRMYNPETDTWTALPVAPNTVSYGGGLSEGPQGYLYALRGINTTEFWRYKITDEATGDGIWSTEVTSAPLTIGYGASMVYDGSQYIYVTRGNGTDTFWRYDTSSDEWSNLDGVDFGVPSSSITNAINRSADMTIDRANGLIYATQGNFNKGFSVYNIHTGTWQILPDTPTLPYDGSAIEFDPVSNAVYFTAGYSTTGFYKFDVATQEWSQLAETPSSMLYGAGIHLIDRSIYTFRGGNTQSFYRYDIESDSWKLPTRGLFGRVYAQVAASHINISTGADVVQGSEDTFYITRGGTSDDFVSYDAKTGQVTQLNNTPSGVTTGSSLVYVPNQNRIYFTSGINETRFYWYDIEDNTWGLESQDPLPVAAANSGSSMVYDKSRYIYFNRGGNSNTFYRYDTQAAAGARWSALKVAPGALGSGAELVLKDGYIYTLQGNNVVNNPLYRYEIANDTWTSLSPLSASVQADGFLVDGGGDYLYASRGLNSPEFYHYSISANSWQLLNNAPAYFSTGAAADSNRLNQLFAVAGVNANNYQDALYTYVQKTEDSSFVKLGSYESPAYDLTSVYKWGPLLAEEATPPNTNITILSRSSADQSTWSDWVAVSLPQVADTATSYKINSPVNRYLQFSFQLGSADSIYSPTIAGYSFSYYQDILPPTNPVTDGFSAYTDASKSATLSNLPTVWHNATAPYFEWPVAELNNGASDTATGSGVLGYYVYFGTNAGGDPDDDGEFQATNSYTPSVLTNNSEHYLRVQTVDEAGNVNPDIWQPFVYRYDADGPSVPSNLVANPSGYSSNPNFAFSWGTASASGALVSSYCYKTATTSGTFASDQCTTELSISNVPAYKVGTNNFSVRAKDEAGNYSNYVTVSYFYADVANAPAPPTNLQVTPLTNSTPYFSFKWDPPEAFLGSASNLTYLYALNVKSRTEKNGTTFEEEFAKIKQDTPNTYLNEGKYAEQKKNTLFVVAKDEAGNVNYNNYAEVDFFSNTTAPGIPTNLEIADLSIKSEKIWRLVVSWEEPSLADNGVDKYKIFRSTDGISFSEVSSDNRGTSFLDSKLDQITYFYKVSACDSTDNCSAPSSVVSLLPDGRFTEPARLISGPTVSTITTKKATISWGTARSADSRIAYGTSSGDYFETEVSSSEQVANHVLTLPNLTPGTTYYYVTKWTDEDGNTGESEEATFSTQPPPTTQEPAAKSVGLTTALIEFTTKNAEKVKLYYGETPSYGGIKELSTGTAEATYTIELGELKDGTKYYYKINTFDIDGTEYEGEMHSFTTLPRPKVDDISITQVQGAAQTTLLIRWKSNTPVSSIVTYFPTAAPQRAKDEVNIALKAGEHRMILLNLEPNTPYSIIIRGKDAVGNEARSDVQQLTTAADTRPPQFLDLKVESEIIGIGEEATVQLLVAYTTDELATSQIEYSEGTGATYSQKTQEDGTRVLQHLVVISGLSPGKVYHLRAVGKDEHSNEGQSIDKVIVTPKATDSALDLVITNLTSVFSFLKTEQ